MKSIVLNRRDFQTPNAEVNYFNDFVLQPLGIPQDKINDVDQIHIFVHSFELED